jgi:YHS domain-containing protein
MWSKGGLALLGAALAVTPLMVAQAREDEKESLPSEVTCAVQTDHKVIVKDAIAKGLYADYEYGRYFFCCAGCPGAFQKDPKKYAANVGISLQKIPLPETLSCAVMSDHKVNVKEATEKKRFADYNGRRYVFCCEGCPAAFKADPAKFAKSVSIPVGQIPLPKEGKCPVTGAQVTVADALAKGRFADYKGKRYLFCCDNCPKSFAADPAKFAGNQSIPSPKAERKEAETR